MLQTLNCSLGDTVTYRIQVLPTADAEDLDIVWISCHSRFEIGAFSYGGLVLWI
jgi:hypothetical protein